MSIQEIGAQFNINAIENTLNNMEELNSVEKFKLNSCFELANMLGEDDSSIEEGAEKNKLIQLIKDGFGNKAGSILSKLGLSSSEDTVQTNEQQPLDRKTELKKFAESVKDNKWETVESNEQKSEVQQFLEKCSKDPNLAADQTFQKYAKVLGAYEKTANSELSKHTLNGAKYMKFFKDLQSYAKNMQNWNNSNFATYMKRGNVEFHNIKPIELTNHQRAWKSDEGYFYPHVDGLIGGDRIEDSSLIPE